MDPVTVGTTITELVAVIKSFMGVLVEPPVVYFTAMGVIGGVAVLVRRLARR